MLSASITPHPLRRPLRRLVTTPATVLLAAPPRATHVLGRRWRHGRRRGPAGLKPPRALGATVDTGPLVPAAPGLAGWLAEAHGAGSSSSLISAVSRTK